MQEVVEALLALLESGCDGMMCAVADGRYLGSVGLVDMKRMSDGRGGSALALAGTNVLSHRTSPDEGRGYSAPAGTEERSFRRPHDIGGPRQFDAGTDESRLWVPGTDVLGYRVAPDESMGLPDQVGQMSWFSVGRPIWLWPGRVR